MAENSVTPGGLTMPVLIAQGSADVIVAPAVTRIFVDQLCARRATVTFLPIEGGDHISVGKTAAANVSRWFADRFAGRAASNNCRR
jgi:alpha-beta hydrolase superfamily lysophospholipase